MSDLNRYFLHWSFHDSVAIVVAVLICAAIATSISLYLTATRRQAAEKVFNHLFLLALASGLLANIPYLFPGSNWLYLAWLFVAAIIGYSFGAPNSRIVQYGKTFCLMFALLIPILFGQLFMQKNWGTPTESLAGLQQVDSESSTRPVASVVEPRRPPVFFFLFDAWSMARSSTDGEFHEYFHNVRTVAEQSLVFEAALSPGAGTSKSLPSILYQSPTDSLRSLPTDRPSVFRKAKSCGYKTALVGILLSLSNYLS